MSQLLQPSTRIVTCGLSSTDISLLRDTLAKGQSHINANWIWAIDEIDSLAESSIVIIDVDSASGQQIWQSLDRGQTPVKVAYTYNPEDITKPNFVLSKPLWISEVLLVMQRVMVRLNVSSTTATTPAPRPISSPTDISSLPKTGHSEPSVQQNVPSSAEMLPNLSLSDRFKLNRWPNFKLFKYTPSHVKIAVLIRKTSHDIETMARLGALSQDETIRFINRCYELGYLDVESASSQAAVKDSPRHMEKKRFGFFQKIRNRLGL